MDGISRVWAIALRSPKDNSLTLLVVNDAQQLWQLEVKGQGISHSLAALHSTPDDNSPRKLQYETTSCAGGVSRVPLPAFSLTIITDTPLPESGPGRF